MEQFEWHITNMKCQVANNRGGSISECAEVWKRAFTIFTTKLGSEKIYIKSINLGVNFNQVKHLFLSQNYGMQTPLKASDFFIGGRYTCTAEDKRKGDDSLPWFSPSTIMGPGIQLRSTGIEAVTFTL